MKQVWSKKFDPKNQTRTHAQLWVRLSHLPREYWRKTTLFEIASRTLHWWGNTFSSIWTLCTGSGGWWYVWHSVWDRVGGKGRVCIFGECWIWEATCVLPPLQMITHSIQSYNRFKYANSQVTSGKQPKHTTQKPHSHHQNATVDKVFKRAASELESLQSKFQIVVPPFGTNSQGTFMEVEVSLLHP